MRTNRLMIEAVACSSLQTAGQHMSDRGSAQCGAQCHHHPGHQSGLFFQNAPGMVTCLNTRIGNKSRSTTDFGKGR